MFTREERSTFPYWFAHWSAFQMTALNCRSWKFRYLFHDIEKPWLKLFLPYEKVQTLHRTYHRHHPEWLENKLSANEFRLYEHPETIRRYLDRFDYDGAIIDWECCHHTKKEEPLDAYDEYRRLLNYDFQKKYPFITKYCYNEFSRRLMDSIRKFGLEHNVEESGTINGWIARDKTDTLYLFSYEPHRTDGIFYPGESDNVFHIIDDIFPKLNWKDGPVEVKVNIKAKYEK